MSAHARAVSRGHPARTRGAPTSSSVTGSSIFVVHGHNEHWKHEVIAFLEDTTELIVAVIERKADLGRTIIEKFEQNAARAKYAVVLLTGDDEGRPFGAGEFQRRARQNVVFELGYFMGALGRPRVAVLYEEGVELLSDVSGLLYIRLRVGWKARLAKELKYAGIDVDLKKVGLGPRK